MTTQQMKAHDGHTKEREIKVGHGALARNYSYGAKWMPGIAAKLGPRGVARILIGRRQKMRCENFA